MYKTTGIPSTLIDVDNKIISQSGWIESFMQFQETTSEEYLENFENDDLLMEDFSMGKISHSFYKNNIRYYVNLIVIENYHFATLFLGQALKEEKNHKSEESLCIIKKEQIQSQIDCIVQMAQMLANNGLLKLRKATLKDNLNKTMEQRIELKNILDFFPVGIAWSDKFRNIEYINHQITQLFGYTIEDIPTVETWYSKAYPDLKYLEEIIKPWHNEVADTRQTKSYIHDLEATIKCKDESERRVFIRVSWIGDKRLVTFNDITKQWKSESRNYTRDLMLEMVAKNTPLTDILNTIVKNMEFEDSSSFCSILLLDKDEKHLLNGAAPSLPDFYNKAIHGLAIGENIGSCGSAAYLKTRVIVDDIMTHRNWQNFKDLALRAKLSSCWSEPIISSTNRVLGTFAIYHSKPSVPNSSDIERINFAANLASIAIENRNTRFELEHRAYSDYLTNLPNRRYFIEQAELELSRYHRYGGEFSLIMFDIDNFKQINDKYGHSIGDLVLQKIAQICRLLLRDIDLIGRIGGEEFALVLPQTNMQEASNVAKKLRIAISKEKIIINEEVSFNFTASFGITCASKYKSIDDLLIQSDLALYEAKNSGRNQVCIFN